MSERRKTVDSRQDFAVEIVRSKNFASHAMIVLLVDSQIDSYAARVVVAAFASAVVAAADVEFEDVVVAFAAAFAAVVVVDTDDFVALCFEIARSATAVVLAVIIGQHYRCY